MKTYEVRMGIALILILTFFLFSLASLVRYRVERGVLKSIDHIQKLPEVRVRNFEEAEKFFLYSEKMRRLWNESNCTSPLHMDSIILTIHIRRENDTFSIACKRGNAYYRFGEYVPLFDECDQEVARVIDNAIRIPEHHDFPLEEPVPPTVNEYYALYLLCDWEAGIDAFAVIDSATGKVYW